MNLVSAKTRIAIGLACLLLSSLCTAIMLGMVPDQRVVRMAARATTCETIALISSDYISRGELRRLEYLLQATVRRNDEILSAGVRRADGDLVATVGTHEKLWKSDQVDRPVDTHVEVPIRGGKRKWGSVELCYQPVVTSGILGFLGIPWLRLTLFVTASSTFMFLFYLGKMLAHLDPSKTVPRRVRSALDSLAEGLLVIDKNQRIVLANQSFANWVHRTPEKLIGVNATKLNWVRNEQGEPLEAYPWVEAIRLETPQAGVMVGLEHKNNPTQILIANASPVLGHDGKYRGVLVSFDDVTLLEATKKDLRIAKQSAENANQAKSQFLAQMSHEIRTPMNAILGYTDVLRRGFDENAENRQDYLNTIHSSGEHLLALINDILDLSKVESGQLELEMSRCAPHKLINEVITLLRPRAAEKNISLEFKCESELPETILTDAVRLRQTIVNLTGNAIKFTETGGVTIAARMLPRSRRQKPQLAIDVIDTGIGIPQSVQEKIFEPFAQADNSVSRRFGGTGLGLAISKQLAEAMGGGISIKSAQGEGSSFTVRVDVGPLDGIAMIDGADALTDAAQPQSETNQVMRLPPARVLVADDGDSNRNLIELVLGRAGLEVVSVENGKLAVDRASESSFDVILMDMQMPVMDGYTATQTLREAGYERPILALTAHAMRGDEEKCREAGCSGFLTKPIKIDVLIQTLADILGAAETDLGGPATVSISAGGGAEDQSGKDEDCQELQKTLAELETFGPPVQGVSSSDDGVDSGPIRCSLPVEDLEFLEIAEEFVFRLNLKITAMRDASSQCNHEELARLAHWLKGSGGTAGFDLLTRPAYELEQAAKSRKSEQYGSLIEAIAEIADRIEIQPAGSQPQTESDNDPATNPLGPIISSLPGDDVEFLEIIEEFVGRLNERLVEMQQLWEARDYDQLAGLAHWLKGSGGTAGFDAFTEPARSLEEAAKQHSDEAIDEAIHQLFQISRRIVIRSEAAEGPTATTDTN